MCVCFVYVYEFLCVVCVYMFVCIVYVCVLCRLGIVTQAHCPLCFPDRSSHWPGTYKVIRLSGQRAPGIQMSPLPQLGLHTQDTTLSASYTASQGGTQPLIRRQQGPLLTELSHQICSQIPKQLLQLLN